MVLQDDMEITEFLFRYHPDLFFKLLENASGLLCKNRIDSAARPTVFRAGTAEYWLYWASMITDIGVSPEFYDVKDSAAIRKVALDVLQRCSQGEELTVQEVPEQSLVLVEAVSGDISTGKEKEIPESPQAMTETLCEEDQVSTNNQAPDASVETCVVVRLQNDS